MAVSTPLTIRIVLYYAWAVHDGDVSADADDDGVADSIDNCTLVSNPAQRDTDSDGFGNFCDADINGDLRTNLSDFSLLRIAFSTADPDADFLMGMILWISATFHSSELCLEVHLDPHVAARSKYGYKMKYRSNKAK